MGSMPNSRSLMPFTALVGQDAMKTALVLNAINPNIGGVLIRGQRGTAKSTAVRALARLLGSRSMSSPAAAIAATRPRPRTGATTAAPAMARVATHRSSAGASGSWSCRSTLPRTVPSAPSTRRPRDQVRRASLRARTARRGEPRHPLRRRGEPARRSHRRRPPRRRGDGMERRRTRRHLGRPPVAIHPRRHR